MLNFAATDNLFMAWARELLKDHPEKDDVLIQEVAGHLLKLASQSANDIDKGALQ